MNRPTAENFSSARSTAASTRCRPRAGLDYNFLFFNLSDGAADGDAARRSGRPGSAQDDFRHAVSAAIDRAAIVRSSTAAAPSRCGVRSPAATRRGVNRAIRQPARSLDRARALLRARGLPWRRRRRAARPARRSRSSSTSSCRRAGNRARPDGHAHPARSRRRSASASRSSSLEFARVRRSADADARLRGLRVRHRQRRRGSRTPR